MAHSVIIVLALLAFVQFSTAALPKNKALFWFSTRSPITEYNSIDFRGCYGAECVYVASSPLPTHPSKNLGQFVPSQKMWATATADDSIEYVFSLERPELTASLWITPVAENRILPAVFNASAYSAEPEPHVAELVSRITSGNIKAIIDHLASYNSRNSYSPDTPIAANWIRDFMTDKGCQNVRLIPFRTGFAPNVVCEIAGTDPTAHPVVVGAHYDSRGPAGNSPTQRAPGADDNGSGSASILDILAIARDLITEEGFSFGAKIIFALFAGEEQGLVGSAALAASYVTAGQELTAMVNLDMIGFPDRLNPQTIYWMSGSTTNGLTDLAFDLTKTYLGESTVLARTTACCSDQQSFYSRGYPAASIFESRTASNNPNYHQSSDLPPTLTRTNVVRNAKSAAALIATLAKVTGPL